MQAIRGVSEIIDKYDLLLLDLWGVVHDGTQLYPGVMDALVVLKKQKKKIIFLSNAPRRSHKVKKVLAGFGIDESYYVDAVSSGEVGYQWLKEGKAPWGKNYVFIGPERDADVVDGLDYVRVNDVAKADFLLNVGYGSEQDEHDDSDEVLRAARNLGLPMLCLNPDLEVIKITGERYLCAGVIGKNYEQMGGKVVWFGKPYANVYEYSAAEVNVPKSRILAVGDSLETDIPGGQAFGVDTLFVSGGIGKHLSQAQIADECEKRRLTPRYIAPSFIY